MSTVALYCWCHSDGASVLLYFTSEMDKAPRKNLNICTQIDYFKGVRSSVVERSPQDR